MKDLELLGSLQCPAEDDHDDLDDDDDDQDHDDDDDDYESGDSNENLLEVGG